RPSTTARAGSTGVVRRLCVRSEARLACQTATSVKVPPTSTAATTGSVTARVTLPSPVRRHYSGLDVGQHCVGHPVMRIAVTETAGEFTGTTCVGRQLFSPDAEWGK